MRKALTVASAFILGVGAGWLIQGRHWDVFVTSYIPALATLLAAFYGAKYAFQFQKDKELEDTKKRNLVSANAAIFALSRMANNLFIYQRDVINPVRNSPGCFLELRPTLDLEKEYIQLNFDTLAFLLETEHMNLLGEVIVETEKYRSAIDAINSRSRLHLQTIQPQIEQASFPAQDKITIQQLEECLGDRLATTLHESTDQVIKHVDSTIISLKDVADRLRKSISLLYPKAKVIGFALPE